MKKNSSNRDDTSHRAKENLSKYTIHKQDERNAQQTQKHGTKRI